MSDGSAAANGGASADPFVGRIIAERFKITSLIARGGMGRVYLAEQAPLGRTCAVKVLNPDFARRHDPEFHKRFFLEASIASRLTHPNTVTIFDFGRTPDDVFYMAMEYLQGHTLHRAIREAGRFSEERAAHVARQICRGLREAHALGAVHRDLKPANVFLAEHGDEADFVKILDFGLVKSVDGGAVPSDELTEAGLFMGSPKYMAPEQIRGEGVDARTDVYALGVVLCEMMTGKVPFDGPTSVDILAAHVNEPAPSLKELSPTVAVSPAAEAMVAMCLAKSPERRYRSMDEVLLALNCLAGARPSRPAGATRWSDPAPAAGAAGAPLAGSFALFDSSPSTSASHTSLSGSASDKVADPARAPDLGLAPIGSVPPVRAGSKGIFVVAGLGALAIAGVLGYGAFWPAADGAGGGPPAVAASAPLHAVRVAAVPAAQRVPTLEILVRSDPAGATVKEDGAEICAATPCDVVYRGTGADPSRDHRLTLARPGYLPQTWIVKAADGPVAVKLVKTPDAAPSGRPGPASPTRDRTDVAR